MAGTNYVGNAYQQLSQMLATPIAGRDSAGFDALSGQYGSTVDTGMADISRRGLSNTGAVPQLYQQAGEQYASGAGQVVASGQAAENQRIQQILQAMLGLGNVQSGQARADMGSNVNMASTVGQGAEALFGNRPPTMFSSGGQGFLSTGFSGNPQSFISNLGRMIGLNP